MTGAAVHADALSTAAEIWFWPTFTRRRHARLRAPASQEGQPPAWAAPVLHMPAPAIALRANRLRSEAEPTVMWVGRLPRSVRRLATHGTSAGIGRDADQMGGAAERQEPPPQREQRTLELGAGTANRSAWRPTRALRPRGSAGRRTQRRGGPGEGHGPAKGRAQRRTGPGEGQGPATTKPALSGGERAGLAKRSRRSSVLGGVPRA
jgi:hypothetical protein